MGIDSGSNFHEFFVENEKVNMAGIVLANILMAQGLGIPYQFLNMLPYVLTVIALAAFAHSAVAPASLGKPYKRG